MSTYNPPESEGVESPPESYESTSYEPADSSRDGAIDPQPEEKEKEDGTKWDLLGSYGLSFLFSIFGAVGAYFLFKKRRKSIFGIIFGLLGGLAFLFVMLCVSFSFPTYKHMEKFKDYRKDMHSRAVTAEVFAYITTFFLLFFVVMSVGLFKFLRSTPEPTSDTVGTSSDALKAGLIAAPLMFVGPLVMFLFPFGRTIVGKLAAWASGTAMSLLVLVSIIRSCILANESDFCLIDEDDTDKCPKRSDVNLALLCATILTFIVQFFFIIVPALVADLARVMDDDDENDASPPQSYGSSI